MKARMNTRFITVILLATTILTAGENLSPLSFEKLHNNNQGGISLTGIGLALKYTSPFLMDSDMGLLLLSTGSVTSLVGAVNSTKNAVRSYDKSKTLYPDGFEDNSFSTKLLWTGVIIKGAGVTIGGTFLAVGLGAAWYGDDSLFKAGVITTAAATLISDLLIISQLFTNHRVTSQAIKIHDKATQAVSLSLSPGLSNSGVPGIFCTLRF